MLRNESGQVTGVSVEEHFGKSDHDCITFKVGLNSDKSGPCDMLASSMWDSSKGQAIKVQDWRVPVRRKNKDDNLGKTKRL